MKAAIYTRVSSDDQIRGTSLNVQERKCREEAERNGWEVVGVFADEGVSSRVAPEDRAAFSRALSLHPDVILALDQDRLVRDEIHVRRLQEMDVRILSLDSFDSHSGDVGSSYRAVSARYEREKIRQRSTRARIQRASEGRWVCGRPPLGYVQEGDSIVHAEDEVAMLREMASLYFASHDLKATASVLNERGHRTRAGNEWDADGVRRVLRNSALTGTFTWQFPGSRILGETFDQQTFVYEAEPVIEHEEWVRLSSLLSRSSRGRYEGRRKYPLTGHVFCEHGRHFTGAHWSARIDNGRERDASGRLYRLDAQQDECECASKTISAVRIESAVIAWITMRLLEKETLAAIIEEHKARHADAVKASKTVGQLRKREEALRRKQEDVYLKFDGEDADRMLDRVSSELASTRAKIASLSETAASVDVTADELADAITSVTGDLRDPKDLQRVARALDVRVTVTQERRGKGRIRVTGTVPVATKSGTHGA